jgi:hypothetical protein
MDFAIESGIVNVAISYTDDLEEEIDYEDEIKQMIGRNNAVVENYQGTHSALIRDWVGIDPRVFQGGNGPNPNIFGSPTNLAIRVSGLPAGDFSYRAFHHDAGEVQGSFELFVTDANRTDSSVGAYQMTSSVGILPGSLVYDVTGKRGTMGENGGFIDYAEGGGLPHNEGNRIFYTAKLGSQVVENGQLRVYLDDLPATVSGLASDRTWYAGVAHQGPNADRFTYVNATLANTDIVGGGPDSSWASGDDGTTGGTVANGSATGDGLWRYRSEFGGNGIWEASSSPNELENAPEIVTSVDLPDGAYSVRVFYLPAERDGGNYPIRAGIEPGPPGEAGTNPGPGNSPLDLPSTIGIPFTSDGVNPVDFVYKVFAEGNGDPNLSIVGVNGFQILPPQPEVPLEITRIERNGTMITLAWASNRNQRYDIEASLDLQSFDTAVVEDIPSQANFNGQATTLTFPLPSELANAPKAFFRIAER